MLRDTLRHLRFFFEQVAVALLGRIADERQIVLHIIVSALEDAVKKNFICRRAFAVFSNDLINVLFSGHPQRAGLNGFEADEAGNVFTEAFDGSHHATFKKELEGNVFAIVVEPGADAAPFNNKYFLGGFAFL